VVFLASDSEDKIEVMPALPVNSQPKSSTGSINTTDDEVECRRKPNKRPRLTKEDTVSLPVTARPKSRESSGKASDDEPKGRRKLNPRRVILQRVSLKASLTPKLYAYPQHFPSNRQRFPMQIALLLCATKLAMC
jgi:hypothetical protein